MQFRQATRKDIKLGNVIYYRYPKYRECIIVSISKGSFTTFDINESVYYGNDTSDIEGYDVEDKQIHLEVDYGEEK